MAGAVLFWNAGILYTQGGQVWDREISLAEAATLAGALSDEGPQHVAVRIGLPRR